MMTLKNIQVENFFWRFSLKKNWQIGRVTTNFTKFEPSTTLRSRDITSDFPLEGFFPLEILPELPVRSKISQSHCKFLDRIKCLAALCFQDKVKSQNRKFAIFHVNVSQFFKS